MSSGQLAKISMMMELAKNVVTRENICKITIYLKYQQLKFTIIIFINEVIFKICHSIGILVFDKFDYNFESNSLSDIQWYTNLIKFVNLAFVLKPKVFPHFFPHYLIMEHGAQRVNEIVSYFRLKYLWIAAYSKQFINNNKLCAKSHLGHMLIDPETLKTAIH